MPVLLEHYNPAVYANLKELEDVNKEVNEHQMQAVLDVIRKQVLARFSRICFLNHFNLYCTLSGTDTTTNCA